MRLGSVNHRGGAPDADGGGKGFIGHMLGALGLGGKVEDAGVAPSSSSTAGLRSSVSGRMSEDAGSPHGRSKLAASQQLTRLASAAYMRQEINQFGKKLCLPACMAMQHDF